MHLCATAKCKKHEWLVDNNSSKHMIGDKDRFIDLQKDIDGIMSFGNDGSSKVLGKGIVKLGGKGAKEKNAFPIENDMI